MTFRHGILGGRRRYSGGGEPAYSIDILYPQTEGQEVAPDFYISFEINGITGINITSPTQGQEVESDFTINFELN